MKYITPEISWHSRDPLYSVDLQCGCGSLRRLATCGTDRVVRMWEIKLPKSYAVVKDKNIATVEFLSTLNRHSRTVNVVRFSPDGSVLASGADDAAVILWRLNDTPPSANLLQDDEEENRESWTAFKVLRSHLEDVYDISWSADSKLLLSGSVDNTAILWDVKKGHKLWMFTEHKGFVQGVAVDPLGQYLATLSDDRFSAQAGYCRQDVLAVYECEVVRLVSRSLRLFSLTSRQLVHDVKRIQAAGNKSVRMFHSAETMKTFFRRLDFSPDGLLLIAPAGCWENASGATESGPSAAINTSYVFCRSNLTRPVVSLVGPSKPTLVVRFCPQLFELRKVPRKLPLKQPENKEDEEEWMKYETLFRLPYRMVFAVASEDAVMLCDTQQPRPFAYLANLHYHTLSDLTWSGDGQLLVVSSTDGYCTLITFDENELGTVYKKCEVMAPVSSPVKPAHQAAKCLSEVQPVVIKECGIVQKSPSVVQTSAVTEPVRMESSPQRKKARRVMLQTLSTNMTDLTQIPRETTVTKTEATKNITVGEPVLSDSERCPPADGDGDDAPCSGQVDTFSSRTNCDLVAGSCEPESMDVSEDIPVAKTGEIVQTEPSQPDLHLVLELSSDTTSSLVLPPSTTTFHQSSGASSSLMPPPLTTVLPTSAHLLVSGPSTVNTIAAPMAAVGTDKKPPRRVQLMTLT